jgi:hypothetical protein
MSIRTQPNMSLVNALFQPSRNRSIATYYNIDSRVQTSRQEMIEELDAMSEVCQIRHLFCDVALILG